MALNNYSILSIRCFSLDTVIRRIKYFYDEYKTIFWSIYLLNIIVYSYLLTQVGFTNHTFPQSWVYHFPSYRTYSEGRWFSDLVTWLFGAAGVQSFQMYISVAIHIINSIFVTKIFSLNNRSTVWLSVLFLSLYPAILDRYSFPGSQIMYVVSDALAISSIMILKNYRHNFKVLFWAAILFSLSLGTYQPAIAFYLLLALIVVLLRLENNNCRFFEELRNISTITMALLSGLALYYTLTKLIFLVSGSAPSFRNKTNSTVEVIEQIYGAYPAFVKYFTSGADYLPSIFHWLPLTLIIVGIISIISKLRRAGYVKLMLGVLLILVIPIALRATYIINNQTFDNLGRLVYQNGHALLFFIVSINITCSAKTIVNLVLCFFVYFMTITAKQEVNRAYLKIFYDTNMINRIVTRIDNTVPDIYDRKLSVVVVGYLSMKNNKYTTYSNNSNMSEFRSEAFVNYRQPEFLNFYYGSDIFDRPTPGDLDSALKSIGSRRPWPSQDSVYLNGNTVVVLLQEYKPGVPTTWTR